MKTLTYIGIIFFLCAILTLDASGQSCNKFHLYGTCMQYPGASYKIDGQSRSNVIGIGDKLVYNVVFYGERDYKLIFCATELFNPVHYVITDAETGDQIYDNKTDDYAETVELNIENTRRLLIEISVLALNTDKQVTQDYFGCVGFLMHYKLKKK